MLNHCRFMFAFLMLIGVAGCGFSETAVSPTIPLPTNTSLPTRPPTETAVATKLPPTAISTPASTKIPQPTDIPTATPRTPTINFHWEAQADGLFRLSGASDGFRYGGYCDEGPFRWLTDTHLLLLPITGYTKWFDDPEGGQVTQPVVLDVTTGNMWTTKQLPTDLCELPVWSDALQALIETDGETVLLHDISGEIITDYPGGNPLHLAPSGLRLLAGKNWIDLETDTIRELPMHDLYRPYWAADETRFFDCCFRYGNAETGSFYNKSEMPGMYVGGIGAGPEYNGSPSRWVLDDQFVISEGGSVGLARLDGADGFMGSW